VFGGQVGVYCNGGANLIEGVHTWCGRYVNLFVSPNEELDQQSTVSDRVAETKRHNLSVCAWLLWQRNDATHAPSPGYGIIVDETQSVRVIGVYLDYTALRIIDPSHVSVVDSFFLGMGTIVIAAGTKAQVDGLVVLDNTWANYNMPHNRTIVVDERNGSFRVPRDVVM
jgi:hypothetical protein